MIAEIVSPATAHATEAATAEMDTAEWGFTFWLYMSQSITSTDCRLAVQGTGVHLQRYPLNCIHTSRGWTPGMDLTVSW